MRLFHNPSIIHCRLGQVPDRVVEALVVTVTLGVVPINLDQVDCFNHSFLPSLGILIQARNLPVVTMDMTATHPVKEQQHLEGAPNRHNHPEKIIIVTNFQGVGRRT